MPKLKEKPEQMTQGDMRHHNTRGMLLSFVERYERMTEEIDGLTDDRKEIVAELKGSGFDAATFRKVIQRRKLDAATRQEADATLELYEDVIREAEKAVIEASEAAAGDPPAKKTAGWGKKADPRQTDSEDAVQAPTEDEVNTTAAKEIGRSADRNGEIPEFLRRQA